MNILVLCNVLAMLAVTTMRAASPDIAQPGQLAASRQLQPTLNPPPEIVSSTPAVTVASLGQASSPGQRLWMGSLFAVIGASTFDAATSWGKEEANPVLRSSSGQFGARGIAIKAGIAGAVLIPQLLLRKHLQLRTLFTVSNFADAAVFTGTAVHNLGVPGQRR
jgi:hypothetical protein